MHGCGDASVWFGWCVVGVGHGVSGLVGCGHVLRVGCVRRAVGVMWKGCVVKRSVSVVFDPVRDHLGLVVRWVGSVLGDPVAVFDRESGRPVRVAVGVRCSIVPSGGGYLLSTGGVAKGGYRHREFATFQEAHDVGVRWAARRFAYHVEGES